jgi:hypothetical protein
MAKGAADSAARLLTPGRAGLTAEDLDGCGASISLNTFVINQSDITNQDNRSYRMALGF